MPSRWSRWDVLSICEPPERSVASEVALWSSGTVIVQCDENLPAHGRNAHGSRLDLEVPSALPDVLSEVFGDEAVVVQLRTGAYYAFDPAATAIWTRMSEASTFGDVDPSGDELAQKRFVSFVRFLVQEELIDVATLPTELTQDSEGSPYPGIEKFTDMADLLVLDPIHDIDLDGSGWPTVPEAAEG